MEEDEEEEEEARVCVLPPSFRIEESSHPALFSPLPLQARKRMQARVERRRNSRLLFLPMDVHTCG